MKLPAGLDRLVLYCAIGLIAAVIHASVLMGFGSWLPLSLANPIGFLAASISDTWSCPSDLSSGDRMSTLPSALVAAAIRREHQHPLSGSTATCSHLVLVFTPTVLFALIRNSAACFSAKARQQHIGQPSLLHADDLAHGVDMAILELAQSGRLQGVSLLVNGATTESPAAA